MLLPQVLFQMIQKALELFSNTVLFDTRLLKENLNSHLILVLYHVQVATADNILEENIFFKNELTRDEAITFKKVVGPDQNSFAHLLMVHLKISDRFQAKVELYRRDRGTGLHFDGYISLRRCEQRDPGCLADASEPDYEDVATSPWLRILRQSLMMMSISQYQTDYFLKKSGTLKKSCQVLHWTMKFLIPGSKR